MKRFLSIMLAFVLLFSVLPMTAYAEEAVSESKEVSAFPEKGDSDLAASGVLYLGGPLGVTGVTVPVAGEYPSYTGVTTQYPEGYFVENFTTETFWKNGIIWSDENGNNMNHSNPTVFQAGKKYKVRISLRVTSSNVEFLYDQIKTKTNTINGYAATVGAYGDGKSNIYLEYTFTAMANITGPIGVTGVTAPVAGAYPSYTGATTLNPSSYVVDDYNSSYYKNGTVWYDENGSLIPNSNPPAFQAGKKYTVRISLVPKNSNTEFDFDTIKTKTNTVNGNTATVGRYSDTCIFLTYTFTASEASYITGPIGVTGVTVPVAGAYPSYTGVTTLDPSRYVVWNRTDGNMKNGIIWYDDNNQQLNPQSPVTFKASHTYRVDIYLYPKNSTTEFDYDAIATKDNTVNGEITFSGYNYNSGYERAVLLSQYFTVPATYNITGPIGVTGVTEPVAGAYPSYSGVTTLNPVTNDVYGYLVQNYTSSSSKYKNGILWREDNNPIDPSNPSPFKAGKTYKVTIALTVANYYAAFNYDAIKNKTNTVNGHKATVSKDNDSIRNIYISYTFTVPSATYITGPVGVTGVTAPVAGAYPSYTGATTLDPSSYVVEDYNGTYYKNGIVWYDENGNLISNANPPAFQAGKTYKVRISLVPKNSNTKFDFDTIKTKTNTVNGNKATVGFFSSSTSNIYIEYTFTVPAATYIKGPVGVTGVTPPVAGAYPSYTGVTTLALSSYMVEDYNGTYYKNGIIWYDENGDGIPHANPTAFQAGKTYKVRISLVPKNSNTKFDLDTIKTKTNTVNGNTATVGPYGDGTSNIYIEYTFTCPAASAVSGTVTSFLSGSDSIDVQLIQGGSVKHSTSVTGNNTTYAFLNVADGAYTLRVSKKNHVTRDYAITVSGSTIKHVKICPIGDADGNGRVNAADAKAVFQHSNGQKKITDPYLFQCADVSVPTNRINAADAKAIFQHSNEQKSLWTD